MAIVQHCLLPCSPFASCIFACCKLNSRILILCTIGHLSAENLYFGCVYHWHVVFCQLYIENLPFDLGCHWHIAFHNDVNSLPLMLYNLAFLTIGMMSLGMSGSWHCLPFIIGTLSFGMPSVCQLPLIHPQDVVTQNLSSSEWVIRPSFDEGCFVENWKLSVVKNRRFLSLPSDAQPVRTGSF